MADFVVASSRATAVDHFVSSIWVTATETAVRINNRRSMSP